VTLLVRHPDTPAGAVQAIDAELVRVPGGAVATFNLFGDVARLVIPTLIRSDRADDLWQTTCFELFVAGQGSSYREFNFSPSGAWAAYDFDAYRSGRRDADASVKIEMTLTSNSLQLIAKIESEFMDPTNVGPTAVIEEVDGIIRYWSTSFAPGKPDFHAAAVRSLLFDGVSAE
jgi:hypothetical protein